MCNGPIPTAPGPIRWPPAFPVYFTLVNGTPAIQQSTIQMTFNGTSVSPSRTPDERDQHRRELPAHGLPANHQLHRHRSIGLGGRLRPLQHQRLQLHLLRHESLAPLWSLAPGSRPYLTNDSATSSALEAGMAYNPVTAHLVVGSLINTNTLRGFYILDALTGNDLGQLPQTNSSGVNVFSPLASGVNYPGYSIGVAADGAIYAASRQTTTSQKYAIYRWASETSAVSVAYGPTTVGTLPFGYDFCVRGAGTSTQIIVGQGNSPSGGTYAILFTTANGTTFSFTAFGSIAGNSDYYGGIAFGTNGTFYAGGFPSTALEYVNYTNKTTLATYPLAAQSGLSFGPLGVDLVNGRVIVLATSTTAGTAIVSTCLT